MQSPSNDVFHGVWRCDKNVQQQRAGQAAPDAEGQTTLGFPDLDSTLNSVAGRRAIC
jgi:hypothetical protein